MIFFFSLFLAAIFLCSLSTLTFIRINQGLVFGLRRGKAALPQWAAKVVCKGVPFGDSPASITSWY